MRRIKNNRLGFSFWKAGAIFYVIFILEGNCAKEKSRGKNLGFHEQIIS